MEIKSRQDGNLCFLFFVLAFGIIRFIAKIIIQKLWGFNMSQFDHVVVKKANVYFDGKCMANHAVSE